MGNSSSPLALATGATGGIGRATCLALLESTRWRGLELRIAVAASKSGPALDALVAELKATARTLPDDSLERSMVTDRPPGKHLQHTK